MSSSFSSQVLCVLPLALTELLEIRKTALSCVLLFSERPAVFGPLWTDGKKGRWSACMSARKEGIVNLCLCM